MKKSTVGVLFPFLFFGLPGSAEPTRSSRSPVVLKDRSRGLSFLLTRSGCLPEEAKEVNKCVNPLGL